MANKVNNNFEKWTDFKVYLQTLKPFFPASDAKEYAKLCADYERLDTERSKYGSDKAEEFIQSINKKAVDNPTPENIAAVAASGPDEIRSRYRNTLEQISNAQQAILNRMKPYLQKIRECVLPIVEKEIERVESEGRSAFERYGSASDYDPERDVLLLKLKRWRDIVGDQFKCERCALHPDQVARWVGVIRPKAGLLG